MTILLIYGIISIVKEVKNIKIEIGTVLKLRCCKEILISLNGDIKEKNVYYEFMIVEDINKKYITVYNVNKQKFIKSKGE